MVVDFMERLVRFRNSFYCFIFFIAIGCAAPVKKESVQAIVLNSNDPALSAVNGIVLFNNQIFTGTLYTLYPDSKDTADIRSYFQGKENGTWKKFYPGGKIKEIRSFDNGKKTGDYTTWWENGNKQQHYFFKDDEYEGLCSEWNINEVLIKEMNYKKGHEEGPQKSYYDNGKIRSNYTIINGRRYGLLGTKNCVNVSDSIFNKL